ncbi:MAG: hypothetical protein ABGF52_08555 [Candidatus Asgardarchaeum sp.]
MLDDISVVLYVLKRLGTVKGRKALQKIIYFVEEGGVPLSYRFRW